MRLNHSSVHRFVLFAVATCFGLSIGCTSFMRNKDKEAPAPVKIELPETVGEVTRPHGLGTVAIENVGLVTGLLGTGSDPPPTPTRQALIEEMKRHNVASPHQTLAKSSTALALVRANLPPGTQKGDRLDVEIRVPSRSKTQSLEGGWLMETQLREVAILNDSVHSGHVRGIVEGPILIDAMTQDNGSQVTRTRGLILGGGMATKSRPLGLRLKSDHHYVSVSKLIGSAINRRFDTYLHGHKQGAATPKTDEFISLEIHPRYRHNLIRYLRVIEQIKLRENQQQLIDRMKTLEGELLVPATAGLAALKLEAIGDEATNTLLRGLDSTSAEVRFLAAEALAYLDRSEAARILGQSVDEPAFRWRALLALSAMSSVEAHDALSSQLNAESAEARYGAFQALQRMNPRDPILGTEVLGSMYLHEVATTGDSMVHISRQRRPEIVSFGENPLATPLLIVVGKQLIVKGESGSRLRVTRYTPGGDDQTQACRADVSSLLRAFAQLEATYPQVVNAIQQAKSQGALRSRLAFDAVPEAGRTYTRATADE